MNRQMNGLFCSAARAVGLELVMVGTMSSAAESGAVTKAEIRTPRPPETPRINGPSVFGVRPGHPVLRCAAVVLPVGEQRLSRRLLAQDTGGRIHPYAPDPQVAKGAQKPPVPPFQLFSPGAAII